MKKILLSSIAFLTPFINFAQETAQQELGLDEQINNWFEPFANAVSAIIFTSIPITDKISLPIVVLLLVGGAFFFTIRFGFVNIRHFGTSINVISGKYDEFDTHATIAPEDKKEITTEEGDLKDTIKIENEDGEVSHFQALMAGLSGTVGLGNIAGVAVAIALGGPGATFWIIIGGLIGMSAKFVECTLGVAYRDIDPDGTVHGGPMYYLKKGFAERFGQGKIGNILGILFAIFCVGASFGGGNAFQSNQMAQQIITLFDLEGSAVGVIIGVILAILVGIVIIGGIKRIASWAEKIVPLMALVYVAGALFIIFTHWELIDNAFFIIMNSAFSPGALLGGVVGIMIVGFQRAAFSNEAGAGTSPIAHAAVKTKYPASEGFVGMMAPFIDTVIICTMTALVIVFFNMSNGNKDAFFTYGANTADGQVILNQAAAGMPAGSEISGVTLTSVAFESGIPHFGIVLTIAVCLFAFSTLISWSYYGIQSWKFLFGKSKASDLTYKFLFLFFVIAGAGATLDAVITFSDAMIFALVFPNMIGLLFLFPVVREEMKKYLSAIKIGKAKKKEREASGE